MSLQINATSSEFAGAFAVKEASFPAMSNLAALAVASPSIPATGSRDVVINDIALQRAELTSVPARKRLAAPHRRVVAPNTPQAGGNVVAQDHDTAPNAGNRRDGPSNVQPSGGGRNGGAGGSRLHGGANGGGVGGNNRASNGSVGEHSDDNVQEGEDGEDHSEDGAEEDAETFKWDTQCAWCDDGGCLLACDGPCLRGFHIGGRWDDQTRVFEPAAELADSCNSLCLPAEVAQTILKSSNPFYCPNCRTQQHMCFQCKNFGKVDVDVFKCISVSCGRYFHKECVSSSGGHGKGKLLQTVKSGPFLCGLHTCKGCGKRDSTPHGDRELIPCRRCPIAWHYMCLPNEISRASQYGDKRPRRLWQPNVDENGRRLAGHNEIDVSLLYCFDHEVDETNVAEVPPNLATPSMMKEWRRYLAELYPHLKWSTSVLSGQKVGVKRSEEPLEASRASKKAATSVGRGLKKAQERSTSVEPHDEVQRLTGRERRLIDSCFENAERMVTKDTVRSKVHHPPPYNLSLKKTVDAAVLHSWEDSIQYANQEFQRTRDINTVAPIISTRAVEKMARQYDDHASAMLPYMHGNRFSSYGRHFTHRDLLETLSARLAYFLQNNDCVVDFSCGTNEFVPLVKRAATNQGIVVTGRAFDIIVARDLTDFVLKSWFETKTSDLPDGKRLVIGLNPPFGKNNSLADKFVDHAAKKFCPRVIVLIVPPKTITPKGYSMVYEDRHSCKGEKFYVPGCPHTSWNKDIPALRILVRNEFVMEARTLGNWDVVPLKL